MLAVLLGGGVGVRAAGEAQISTVATSSLSHRIGELGSEGPVQLPQEGGNSLCIHESPEISTPSVPGPG